MKPYLSISLLASLLISNVSVPALSQSSPQINCRDVIGVAEANRVSLLESYAQRSFEDNNIALAVTQYTQATQQALQIKQPEFSSDFLLRLSESDAFGNNSRLEEIVKQSNAKNKVQTIAFLSGLTKLTQTLDSSYSNTKTKTLIKLAAAYCLLNQPNQSRVLLDQARQTVGSIANIQLQAQALTGIAREYVAINQFSAAESALTRSLEVVRRIPNPDQRINNLVSIVTAYAEMGQFDRAAQVAQQLKIPYGQSVAQTEIVRAYLKRNQFDAAEKTAQTIKSRDVKPSTLNEIAIALLKANQVQRSNQRFAQAVQFARQVNPNNDFPAVRIIQDYAEAGGIDSALRFAQTLKEPTAKYTAISEIAIVLGQKGNVDRATSLIAQALQLIKNQPNYATASLRSALTAKQYRLAFDIASQMDVSEIMRFAIAATDAGQSDLAMKAIQVAQTKLTNAQDRVALPIVAAYVQSSPEARLQKVREQAQFVAANTNKTTVSDQLAQVMRFFFEAQHYDVAFQIAQAMPDPTQRSFEINRIFSKFLEQGELSQAKEAVNAIAAPNIRSLIELAKQLIQTNPNQTIETLNQAFQVALTVADPESKIVQVNETITLQDDSDRASLLQNIATLYARIGQIDRAMQVSQKIQDAKIRDSLQQQINCYRNPS